VKDQGGKERAERKEKGSEKPCRDDPKSQERDCGDVGGEGDGGYPVKILNDQREKDDLGGKGYDHKSREAALQSEPKRGYPVQVFGRNAFCGKEGRSQPEDSQDRSE